MARLKLEKVAETTYAFRIGYSEKGKLEKKINAKRNQLNSKLSEAEYKINKE